MVPETLRQWHGPLLSILTVQMEQQSAVVPTVQEVSTTSWLL